MQALRSTPLGPNHAASGVNEAMHVPEQVGCTRYRSTNSTAGPPPGARDLANSTGLRERDISPSAEIAPHRARDANRPTLHSRAVYRHNSHVPDVPSAAAASYPPKRGGRGG